MNTQNTQSTCTHLKATGSIGDGNRYTTTANAIKNPQNEKQQYLQQDPLSFVPKQEIG